MFKLRKQPEWTVYVPKLVHCSQVAKDILKLKGQLIAVYESFGIIIAEFNETEYEHILNIKGVERIER